VSWKKFIFGASIGAATALLLQSQLNKEYLSAEKALRLVKDSFKKDGPIEGSWIKTDIETVESDETIYSVYKGGVSKEVDGELTHYDFSVDAKTGALVEVKTEQ
jgi:predicted small secreted protein